MNKQIEFRGKRIDNGEWVYGYYVYDYRKEIHYIFTNIVGITNAGFKPKQCDYQLDCFEVDPSTIGQFTGLVDKNEKRIYEFDIVEAWSQGSNARGVIEQRIDGHWIMYPCWQNSEMWYLMPNESGKTTVKVIGNIFDKENE